MTALLEETSTVTTKGQTTLPKAVRQSLRVGSGDRVVYRVLGDNEVLMSRADNQETDPAIDAFLGFIARDMQRRPEALLGLTPEFRDRIYELTDGVMVDLGEAFEGEVAL